MRNGGKAMEMDTFPEDRDIGGLYVCQVGQEACEPGHAYGPAVRDHHLIHFVASGEGVFRAGGRVYPVRAGQGFLILPEESTQYQADEKNPWHYAWVGYQGEAAGAFTRMAGLDSLNRVFTPADPAEVWHTLTVMRRDVRALRLHQMAAVGSLYRFFSLIAPEEDAAAGTPNSRYLDKALWFMENGCDRAVSVQETADYVGLSRSQLYRVFMTGCGCSPKETLSRIRLRQALRLLESTSLTVEEIARQIGLQTGAQLSRIFRERGLPSPSVYRGKKERP